jgi:hypothetical protein
MNQHYHEAQINAVFDRVRMFVNFLVDLRVAESLGEVEPAGFSSHPRGRLKERLVQLL